jgi:hypothetical protein
MLLLPPPLLIRDGAATPRTFAFCIDRAGGTALLFVRTKLDPDALRADDAAAAGTSHEGAGGGVALGSGTAKASDVAVGLRDDAVLDSPKAAGSLALRPASLPVPVPLLYGNASRSDAIAGEIAAQVSDGLKR